MNEPDDLHLSDELRTAEARVETHSRELKKELGLRDLVLTQILFIVGLPWVGVAAKLGTSHILYWLLAILLFYIPFALLFVLSNVAKFAPWEWDNIKILIYWYLGSLPLIAYAIVWVWQQNLGAKIVAAVGFVVLIFAGSLDVWRTVSGQTKMRVFEADGLRVAELIKKNTEPNALVLNAPTYNAAVVLSGRQSLMRYSGHLSSHGIDYAPRESDVRHIYEGGGLADVLLKKYNIGYVLVSPEERNTLKANEEFFKRYPVVAESGQYRVYKVTN